jgi:hypothetical protein
VWKLRDRCEEFARVGILGLVKNFFSGAHSKIISGRRPFSANISARCCKLASMNTPVGLVSGPLNCDVILQQLRALPIPRRVVSSWRGKLSSLVAYLGLSFFGVLSIGLIWKGFSGGQIGWTIVALILLVLALLALLDLNSKLTRPNQRSLLATGEVTVGRIVTQRVQGGSRGAWSEIT